MSAADDEKTVKWAAPSKGWTAIPNQVLADRELSRNARLAFGLLAMYAWQEESSYPGQERVAWQLDAKPRALHNWIAELAEADVLTVERRGAMRTNRYVLHPERRYVGDRHGGAGHDRHEGAGHNRNNGAAHDRHGGADEEEAVDVDAGEKDSATSADPAEVERLCKLQLELASQRAESQRLKITDTWRTEMDRLMRLDGRSPRQVEYVIRWVHDDGFWGPVVLSVPKLREQFDTLVARIKAKANGKASTGAAAAADSTVAALGAEADALERGAA